MDLGFVPNSQAHTQLLRLKEYAFLDTDSMLPFVKQLDICGTETETLFFKVKRLCCQMQRQC